MESEVDKNRKGRNLARFVAGLLFLAILSITLIKPAVLFPSFWKSNQCYICFRQAIHSETYFIVGKPDSEFDLKFCEKHSWSVPTPTSESVPGRGLKIFLFVAMIVLPSSFLWGNFMTIFVWKTPGYAYWLLCLPLFLILLGICFYLLHLEIAGRIISWVILSFLMFVWLSIFFAKLSETGSDK